MKKQKLSHYDQSGVASMVDVSKKAISARAAIAHAYVSMPAEVIAALPQNKKGDPLEVARIAGISAAKKTAELIPLCHQLPLSHVAVEFRVEAGGIAITASARTVAQTGVEMEAMTAAAVAALTVYDMTKALNKAIEIREIHLLEKTGGKSGDIPARTWEMIEVAILTVSDSAFAGTRVDASGPGLAARVAELGWLIAATAVVQDDETTIATKLREWSDAGYGLILTTGGTGLAARDVTPEATRSVLDREVLGIAEHIRTRGMEQTKLSVLSRGLAGQRKRSLIVNLPGSPKGALFSLKVIEHLVPHVVDLLQGRTEHA